MLTQKVVVNASNEFVSKQYCSKIVSFSSCNTKDGRDSPLVDNSASPQGVGGSNP